MPYHHPVTATVEGVSCVRVYRPGPSPPSPLPPSPSRPPSPRCRVYIESASPDPNQGSLTAFLRLGSAPALISDSAQGARSLMATASCREVILPASDCPREARRWAAE